MHAGAALKDAKILPDPGARREVPSSGAPLRGVQMDEAAAKMQQTTRIGLQSSGPGGPHQAPTPGNPTRGGPAPRAPAAEKAAEKAPAAEEAPAPERLAALRLLDGVRARRPRAVFGRRRRRFAFSASRVIIARRARRRSRCRAGHVARRASVLCSRFTRAAVDHSRSARGTGVSHWGSTALPLTPVLSRLALGSLALNLRVVADDEAVLPVSDDATAEHGGTVGDARIDRTHELRAVLVTHDAA